MPAVHKIFPSPVKLQDKSPISVRENQIPALLSEKLSVSQNIFSHSVIGRNIYEWVGIFCPPNLLPELTHLCRPVCSTFAVRETVSLGIMGTPRVPPFQPGRAGPGRFMFGINSKLKKNKKMFYTKLFSDQY